MRQLARSPGNFRVTARPHTFQLVPSASNPIDLRVVCVNRRCEFTRNRALPLLAKVKPSSITGFERKQVEEIIGRASGLTHFIVEIVPSVGAFAARSRTGSRYRRADRWRKWLQHTQSISIERAFSI